MKNLRKHLILLTVMTVMLVCVFAMTAGAAATVTLPNGEETTVDLSVACPFGSEENGETVTSHLKEYEIPVTFAPTCEQIGYTRDYCVYCKTYTSTSYNEVAATGHSYSVSYVSKADSYERTLTCQNALCRRAETAGEADVINSVTTDAAKYYLVSFINTYESPDSSCFLDTCYVESSISTWVATSYKYKSFAPSDTETTDGAIKSPAYEYAAYADSVSLFVKDGEKAVYNGKTPYRYKDLTVGKYTFNAWVNDGAALADKTINANTVFTADFIGDTTIQIPYTFYNEGAAITDSRSIPYGQSISYGDLATPTKKNTAQYTYSFAGWYIQNKPSQKYPGKNASIPLYFGTSIYAYYDISVNKYDITFLNNKGSALYTDEDVAYGESADSITKITSAQLEIPRDKQYIYTFTNKWKIAKIIVDGTAYTPTAAYQVNPEAINLPDSIAARDEAGNYKTLYLKGGEEICIEPVYSRTDIIYTVRIRVDSINFEPEDQFSDNSMQKEDLLEGFTVQVTDSNGQWLAGGRTNSKGECYVNIKYKDVLIVSAANENGKYAITEQYNFTALSTEEVTDIMNYGFVLAPRLTDEWIAGNTHSCSCICHSFLSPIVIRIYNILYRLFNIKYVCCDDMFAAHGGTLAYTK